MLPSPYRSVIPAQAGIQGERRSSATLDSRLRGNDGKGVEAVMTMSDKERLQKLRVKHGRQPVGAAYASLSWISWLMAAVLPNMIEAEQYFSADKATARSTLSSFRLWPAIL